MRTCKDCLHYKVCRSRITYDENFGDSTSFETKCADFKSETDYQKVFHAKWIKISDYPLYECSNCHSPAAKNNYGYHAVCDTYCRTCGAKMDLEW